MAVAIARSKNAMIVRFMVALLFVEKLQHVVSGFFVLHYGKLANDISLRRGILFVAREGHEIVRVAGNKQGIEHSPL
jgi:hypothetical protein